MVGLYWALFGSAPQSVSATSASYATPTEVVVSISEALGKQKKPGALEAVVVSQIESAENGLDWSLTDLQIRDDLQEGERRTRGHSPYRSGILWSYPVLALLLDGVDAHRLRKQSLSLNSGRGWCFFAPTDGSRDNTQAANEPPRSWPWASGPGGSIHLAKLSLNAAPWEDDHYPVTWIAFIWEYANRQPANPAPGLGGH